MPYFRNYIGPLHALVDSYREYCVSTNRRYVSNLNIQSDILNDPKNIHSGLLTVMKVKAPNKLKVLHFFESLFYYILSFYFTFVLLHSDIWCGTFIYYDIHNICSAH